MTAAALTVTETLSAIRAAGGAADVATIPAGLHAEGADYWAPIYGVAPWPEATDTVYLLYADEPGTGPAVVRWATHLYVAKTWKGLGGGRTYTRSTLSNVVTRLVPYQRAPLA